jgi:hypothetical protein
MEGQQGVVMRKDIAVRLNPYKQYLGDRPRKPHIWLEGGYYRVSVSLLRWQAPIHVRRRWVEAHTFVAKRNEAREFGMVTPEKK